jgi:hypothetical protein
MRRANENPELACIIKSITGILFALGMLDTVAGVLALRGQGSYGQYNSAERAGFSSAYFVVALALFGTSAKIYHNVFGMPRLTFWSVPPQEIDANDELDAIELGTVNNPMNTGAV